MATKRALSWAERRVFVTGATGIVGSWTVKELLRRKAYVAVLVRDWDPQSELIRGGDINRATVINGKLEDYDSLERGINEQEVDTVIHLGAQPIVNTALRNPLATFEANIRGTYNLLEACRRQSSLVKSVVVASSDKAYGESEKLPYTEDMPANGRHPYDMSKSCTDLIAMTYAHTYGLPVAVARCGNIYGGGDLNWNRIVPGTIKSILRSERPVLRSDGKMLRDYIFVDDVVDAYLALAERSNEDGIRGEAFNFSVGGGITVLEIVEKLQKLMGREDLKPMILDQARSEIRAQYLDSTKAKLRLGWTAKFALEEGLKRTIPWYTDFLERSGK